MTYGARSDFADALHANHAAPSEGLDDTITVTPSGVTLYRDQREMVGSLIRLTRAGVLRILLNAPTGAGKSVMLAAFTVWIAREGRRVVIFAHTREIVKQTARKLRDAGVSDLGVYLGKTAAREPWMGSFGGLSAQVLVGTIQSLRSLSDEALSDVDAVIVDEAHHAPAKTYRAFVRRFPGAQVVGATATPFRGAGKGLGSDFDAIVQGPSIKTLVSLGRLAPSVVYTWAEILNLDLRDVPVSGGTDGERDFNAQVLARRVNKAKLRGDILAHWHRHARGLRTIVFAASLEHAQAITRDFNHSAEFKTAGWVAEYLDGQTSTDDREAMLERLKTSEKTRVVVNYAVLTEGFDAPMVEAVVLARPTLRPAVYLQAIGRGMRVVDGKRHVVVLDHAGLCLMFGMPDEDRVCDLDGLKRTPQTGGGGVIPVVMCPACGRTMARGCEVCPNPACGAVSEGGGCGGVGDGYGGAGGGCAEGASEGPRGESGGERVGVPMIDPEGVLVEVIRERWTDAEVRTITHDGKTRTIAQWAEEIGVTQSTIYRRLCEGASPQEALAPAASAQMLTHDGKTRTIEEWSQETGVARDTIRKRLRDGATAEEALTPRFRVVLTHDGRTQTVQQWAKELGIGVSVIRARLQRGDSIEQALRPLDREMSNELTHDGRTQTVQRWAEEIGISDETIRRRIKSGLTIAEVLAPKAGALTLTHGGRTQTVRQWAEEIGVDRQVIRYRVRKGFPIAEVLAPKTETDSTND